MHFLNSAFFCQIGSITSIWQSQWCMSMYKTSDCLRHSLSCMKSWKNEVRLFVLLVCIFYFYLRCASFFIFQMHPHCKKSRRQWRTIHFVNLSSNWMNQMNSTRIVEAWLKAFSKSYKVTNILCSNGWGIVRHNFVVCLTNNFALPCKLDPR